MFEHVPRLDNAISMINQCKEIIRTQKNEHYCACV